MRQRLFLLALSVVLVTSSPAWAHAERSGSDPKEGQRLKEIPVSIAIDFTEPPIADAGFEVLDGCERDVVSDIEVQNTEITASLAKGQPGKWTVRTHVVSGIDGHPTKERWSFTVAGSADCEKDPGGGGGQAAPPPEPGGGSTFPVLAFVGGTVVLAALALLLRRKGG